MTTPHDAPYKVAQRNARIAGTRNIWQANEHYQVPDPKKEGELIWRKRPLHGQYKRDKIGPQGKSAKKIAKRASHTKGWYASQRTIN